MTRRPEARDPHATLAQPRSPPKSFEVRWLSVSPTTSALPVGSMEDEPASTRSKQYQAASFNHPLCLCVFGTFTISGIKALSTRFAPYFLVRVTRCLGTPTTTVTHSILNILKKNPSVVTRAHCTNRERCTPKDCRQFRYTKKFCKIFFAGAPCGVKEV